MVSRIYVEKKPGFDVEAGQLLHELQTILGVKALTGLRLVNRYDVEGISDELFKQCIPVVFSEPQVDTSCESCPEVEAALKGESPAGQTVFAIEFLPGQFDQRADSASECIQLISQGERPLVRSARVYLLEGALTDEQLAEYVNAVIDSQSTDVDVIAGATVDCQAIATALIQAFAK